MATTQWSPDCSVHNEVLDVHHRIFFEMVAELQTAVEHHDGNMSLQTVIAFLHEYVNMHFQAEERYMTLIGFPELKTHSAVHQQFSEHVNTLLGAPQQSTTVLEFMQRWFMQHILQEDRAYALYAQRPA